MKNDESRINEGTRYRISGSFYMYKFKETRSVSTKILHSAFLILHLSLHSERNRKIDAEWTNRAKVVYLYYAGSVCS